MKYEIFRFFMNILPHKLGHKLLYRQVFHRKLNLKQPIGLNEKIQYLILNELGDNESDLSDKVKVKEILTHQNIDGLRIPKTLFTFKSKAELKRLNRSELPEKFVLKCNHGSGHVFVCYDINNFSFDEKINILLKDLKKDFSKNSLEYHYSGIEPCIMIEEYLEDSENKLPLDYKFFSYNGNTKYVMVCTERESGYKATFFDKNWNKIDYSMNPSSNEIKKPKNLEKMWEISEKLSKGHKFVRVDLYNINGEVYFSELTFTPAAGLSRTYTSEGNKILGSYLKI